jgi:tol-pal system protein YbgF
MFGISIRNAERTWLGRFTFLCLVGAVLLSLGTLSSRDAFAQSSDVQALLDRINRLEADLNNVQRKVFQGQDVPAPNLGGGSSGSVGGSEGAAILSARIDGIEDEQRRLTGTNEEVNFQIGQLKSRLDKLVLDVDFRLTEIERRLNSGAVVGGQQTGAVASSVNAGNEPTATGDLPKGSKVLGTLKVNPDGTVAGATTAPATPAATATQTATLNSAGTPAEQYNAAITMLRNDDFTGAETAFAAFLQENGEHSLAGNAQFWLGQTFYVRGDYPNAASAFLNGYQNYPKNTKAADNLLKLAMTLGRMEQLEEACATFQQLEKQFANMPNRIKRLAAREKTNFKCN